MCIGKGAAVFHNMHIVTKLSMLDHQKWVSTNNMLNFIIYSHYKSQTHAQISFSVKYIFLQNRESYFKAISPKREGMNIIQSVPGAWMYSEAFPFYEFFCTIFFVFLGLAKKVYGVVNPSSPLHCSEGNYIRCKRNDVSKFISLGGDSA